MKKICSTFQNSNQTLFSIINHDSPSPGLFQELDSTPPLIYFKLDHFKDQHYLCNTLIQKYCNKNFWDQIHFLISIEF